jgi:hypothetical protein
VFTRGSGAGDAICMLRIMSKRTLDIEACACFIHWQKECGSGKWTKLKNIVVDWGERRLVCKLYMAQSVTIPLDQRETRTAKIVR